MWWEISNFLRHSAGHCDIYHGQVKLDNKKNKLDFTFSCFKFSAHPILGANGEISDSRKEPTRKSKNLQKCLQLCHTKYHITFLSTYFSNVRDPFPPQTVSKISHHKIKYMLKPCKDIFDEKKLLSQALLHPETGIFVSNYIQKGWLVSRLLCRVAVSREMKEQR